MIIERPCPSCASPLDAAALEGLCSKCVARGLVKGLPLAEMTADYPRGPDLAATVAPIPEGPGTVIGRYKLLQRLGEGGFGVVFMAEQREPIIRRVALKVLKQGMDTREVIARFEAERQALALMDHPAIARVFDAGATDTGRPFFVMELVRGMPITRFCDEHGLDLHQRLELFAEVCSAVQHAHQKGIIHRDLKPSNILVGLESDRPVPKVIDFGIAKATQQLLTDKTLFTRFNQFLGTPQYVSPEQVGMNAVDVDTRSDIYSLGVVLYELLTGNPPLDAQEILASGFAEMQRIIREIEPPRPSTRLSTLGADRLTTVAKHRGVEPGRLGVLLRGDLDWIVLKAIEKDRARRYETASALAADIRRHLSDEPVSATPPGAAYKFGKFARRHKGRLAAVAAIAAILVAATVVSTWQALQATQARKETAATLGKVIEERDAKEQARRDAEAIAVYVTEVFQSPDPARDGREVKVAEMLDRAAERLESDLATQPGVRAMMQATLSRTYWTLGLFRDAIALQEKVRDYYLTAFGSEHHKTLNAVHNLANLYAEAGRRDEALKVREEVLTSRRRLLGREHRDTLQSMGAVASSYADVGRREAALELREEVLALSRRVLGLDDLDTLAAMSQLAISYGEFPDRREQTRQLREEVLAMSRKVKGAEHPETIGAMHNVAVFHISDGNPREAIGLLEEVLDLSRKVKGPEHPHTLMAISVLAKAYHAAARWKEAIELGEEAMVLHHKVFEPEHPSTLEAMIGLSSAYRSDGQPKKSIDLLEKVLAIRREELGSDHFETLGAMTNLAALYGDDGRVKEGIVLQEESLKHKRLLLTESHPWLVIAVENLARLYELDERLDEALELRKESVMLRERAFGPDHLETMEARAAVEPGAGGPEEVTRDEKTVDHRRATLGPDHPGTIAALTNLAVSQAEAGNLDKAIELQEESLALMRRTLPKSHPMFPYALGNLSALYTKTGQKDKAEAMAAELKSLETAE